MTSPITTPPLVPTKRSSPLIFTFLAATFATTWIACFLLRGAAAAGNIRAIWTFILVTVWSPTAIALVATALFRGPVGVRALLSRLFRPMGRARWYLLALLTPAFVVLLAVLFARVRHEGAPFLPLAALLPVVGIQLATGAIGEELGWRGLLLSELRTHFSALSSAVLMAVLWSLWHVPAFFFPYMPQQRVSAPAFLIAVAAFAIFMAFLYERTNGHVLVTMIAHASLNIALALGGANFSSTLWWFLAGSFLLLAVLCGRALLNTAPPAAASL